MVALLYALGIFQLGLAPLFFIVAEASGRDSEFLSGAMLVLAVGSLPLAVLLIAAGWILDRVLHVKRTVEQMQKTTPSQVGASQSAE